MSFLTKRIFLATLSIPAATLLLATYLHNHPLPASKSQIITAYNALPASHAASRSFRIVNPRSHRGLRDTRTIILSKREIGELGDEEILARFVRGYFGGWVFRPELGLGRVADAFGTVILRVGFTEMDPPEDEIMTPPDLSLKSLPPKGMRIVKGVGFMILNHHIARPSSLGSSPTDESVSFIEIGYGDDRKTFSGMKRFEIQRNMAEGKEESVLLTDSSLACNPAADVRIGRWLPESVVRAFHDFYALCLFRDGVREVLS